MTGNWLRASEMAGNWFRASEMAGNSIGLELVRLVWNCQTISYCRTRLIHGRMNLSQELISQTTLY